MKELDFRMYNHDKLNMKDVEQKLVECKIVKLTYNDDHKLAITARMRARRDEDDVIVLESEDLGSIVLQSLVGQLKCHLYW